MIDGEILDSILVGDCRETLKDMPDCSVDCCVTSPPYFGLRDYGNPAQIGMEDTPQGYISQLVLVFREVRRVLKEDGTLWLNIGDSYCNSNGYARASEQFQRKGRNNAPANDRDLTSLHDSGFKTKDLIGIPWMLAFALREDGWYLRQDIIWQKPNPMPESVKDRCTKSHEYIFLMSKSPKYYFDAEAIAEPVTESTTKRLSQNVDAQNGSGRVPGKTNGNMKACYPKFGGNKYGDSGDEHLRTYSGNEYRPKNLQYDGQSPNTMHMRRAEGYEDIQYAKRNKRDVWTVAVQPTKEAHFATYPEKLVRPCILAGCRKGGVVLDPFFGSGTTGRVAIELGRHYIGCELNDEYIKIAERRTDNIQLSFV